MAKFLNDAIKGINKAQSFINDLNPAPDPREQFRNNGFLVSSTPAADGNGLPYSKVKTNVAGQIKRNIITWFVPQFGIVRMYVNPQGITYNHKKLISKERTKGGFTLQYWGEDLTTLNINGTTGSSGIEGINMLYEVYRAEQYAFDAVGLTLAANNASADLAGNLVNGIGGAIGKGVNQLFGGNADDAAAAGGAGLLGGILGLNSPNNNLATKNIPSLASLAFGVEMYYNGWVYRGYFDSMVVNERADNFLLDYQMTFIATQRRGYRTNYFPFHKSPSGPSQYDTPNSFNGKVTNPQSSPLQTPINENSVQYGQVQVPVRGTDRTVAVPFDSIGNITTF